MGVTFSLLWTFCTLIRYPLKDSPSCVVDMYYNLVPLCCELWPTDRYFYFHKNPCTLSHSFLTFIFLYQELFPYFPMPLYHYSVFMNKPEQITQRPYLLWSLRAFNTWYWTWLGGRCDGYFSCYLNMLYQKVNLIHIMINLKHRS